MNLEAFNFKQYVFPGAGGAHQREGRVQDLTRELGDNYTYYHEQLAVSLESLGGRPDPADYREDFEAYCHASDYFVETIKAEVLLRQSYAVRHGRVETQSPPAVG